MAKTSPKKSGAKPKDPEAIGAACAEAALRLAGTVGWRHVRLEEVADEAGVTLGDLRRVAADKTDLLARFIRHIDAEVLAEESGFRPEDSVRDRLFDLLMRRFDALDPYKAGVDSAFQDTLRDPISALRIAPAGVQALGWYLEAAGESADGPIGALRLKGLAAVWLSALRAWFRDESADLSHTMKALDQGLARAEQAAGWLSGRGRRRETPDDAAPGDAEDGTADAAAR